MIRYYCDGSFKEGEKTVGCGIVRVHEKEESHHFFYTNDNFWFDKHEEYAIYQTLLLIETYGDRQVTMYNDEREMLRILFKTKNTKWKKRLKHIFKKLNDLQQMGYKVQFKYNNEKQSVYMQMAHHLSRTYLNEQQNIQKVLQKLKRKEERRIEKKQEMDKRKILQNNIKETKEQHVIDTKVLKQCVIIYFKKVSKRRWGAFAEGDVLIYVNQSIAEVTYSVLEKALQYKQTVQVNKEYESMFTGYFRSGTIEPTYEERMNIVKRWIDEKRIQFV